MAMDMLIKHLDTLAIHHKGELMIIVMGIKFPSIMKRFPARMNKHLRIVWRVTGGE